MQEIFNLRNFSHGLYNTQISDNVDYNQRNSPKRNSQEFVFEVDNFGQIDQEVCVVTCVNTDNQPLANCMIFLNGDFKGTTSFDGIFQFITEENSEVQIVCVCEGYANYYYSTTKFGSSSIALQVVMVPVMQKMFDENPVDNHLTTVSSQSFIKTIDYSLPIGAVKVEYALINTEKLMNLITLPGNGIVTSPDGKELIIDIIGATYQSFTDSQNNQLEVATNYYIEVPVQDYFLEAYSFFYNDKSNKWEQVALESLSENGYLISVTKPGWYCVGRYIPSIEINGTVYLNHKQVPFANVEINNLKFNTLYRVQTNENGNFKAMVPKDSSTYLVNLTVGTRTIRCIQAQARGHKDFVLNITSYINNSKEQQNQIEKVEKLKELITQQKQDFANRIRGVDNELKAKVDNQRLIFEQNRLAIAIRSKRLAQKDRIRKQDSQVGSSGLIEAMMFNFLKTNNARWV